MIRNIEKVEYKKEHFNELLNVFVEAYDDDAFMATGEEYRFKISSSDDLLEIINKSNMAEVFIYKNKVIGGLFLNENVDNIEIVSIFLDPFYHNIDIGSHYINALTNNSKKDFYAIVSLYSNRLMYFFSKKCGFKIDNKDIELDDKFIKYIKKCGA